MDEYEISERQLFLTWYDRATIEDIRKVLRTPQQREKFLGLLNKYDTEVELINAQSYNPYNPINNKEMETKVL